MAECQALRAWARAQPPEYQPAARQEQIERHLEFLAATLPSRAIDDESGKKRFAVYISLLGSFSNEALSHMARRACETYDWFPTPRQCIDLANEYCPPTTTAMYAISQCNNFDHDRFEQWIAALPTTGDFADAPPHWIEIAVTRNILRRDENKNLSLRTPGTSTQGREINAGG